MMGAGVTGALMVWWIVGLIIYFIPTIIAIKREHPNRVAIICLNVLLGWVIIGWVGALIWSVLAIPEQKEDK